MGTRILYRVLLTLLPRKDYNVALSRRPSAPNPLTVDRSRFNADWTVMKERRSN
jgi:hypothetical protein